MTAATLVFRVPVGELPKLRRHPLLRHHAASRASTRRLRTVYYDSPDLRLHRHALSLPVDQPATESDASTAEALPLGAIVDPAARQALANLDADPLRPVFDLVVARTTRRLRLDGDSVVRMDLEVGELRASDRCTPVCRLGLALESGDPRRLYDLAQELRRGLSLRLETASLAEDGYALIAESPRTAVKAGEVRLSPSMTLEEAIAEIFSSCLNQLAANEAAVLERRRPEGVHQMRVSLRRLRAAIALFKRVIPDAQRDWIGGETKWLAGALGEARDWDVFLAGTLPPIRAALPDDAELAQLAERAAVLRAIAYDQVVELMGSDRYGNLLLKLRWWVQQGGWRDQPVSEVAALLFQPVAPQAAELLRRRHKAVRKQARDLASLPAEARHEVRKKVKKLRYSVDFLGSLFPVKRVAAYVEPLACAQDALGELNDLATARRLVAELGERSPDLRYAAGLVLGWQAAGVADGDRTAGRIGKQLAKAEPFWA